MKKVLSIVSGALAVSGFFVAGTAMAGIAATEHNLSAIDTGHHEICVFCHTPHGANTAAVVPLWNKKLGDPSIYQTYDSLGTTTLDGKIAPVGSVSIACLSCHDGTQAMNVVLNAPGSQNYDPSGVLIGSSEVYIPSGIANLGTDLRNDHPVGVQYGGGGITESSPDASTKDPDFVGTKHATLNNQLVWWVDTSAGSSDTREKTDMILYTREMDGSKQPFVECASCHDPHTSATETFLRINNSGSAVCLACHTK